MVLIIAIAYILESTEIKVASNDIFESTTSLGKLKEMLGMPDWRHRQHPLDDLEKELVRRIKEVEIEGSFYPNVFRGGISSITTSWIPSVFELHLDFKEFVRENILLFMASPNTLIRDLAADSLMSLFSERLCPIDELSRGWDYYYIHRSEISYSSRYLLSPACSGKELIDIFKGIHFYKPFSLRREESFIHKIVVLETIVSFIIRRLKLAIEVEDLENRTIDQYISWATNFRGMVRPTKYIYKQMQTPGTKIFKMAQDLEPLRWNWHFDKAARPHIKRKELKEDEKLEYRAAPS